MFFIFLSIVASVLMGTLIAKIFFRGYHTALGFAGGAIIALVCVEIIPHLFMHGGHTDAHAHAAPLGVLFGFLCMHIFEKVAGFHEHAHGGTEVGSHVHVHGSTALILLSVHAFIDGLGIGAAYVLSSTLVSAILFAFLLHKIVDGAAIASLAHAHQKPLSFFLGLNISLTMLGVFLATAFTIPEEILVSITAGVAGVLLYIASAHILPEAHARTSAWKTIFATWVGALLVVGLSFLH